MLYEAYGFEWVKAYSTTGDDVVSRIDSLHEYEMVLDGEWHEK